MLSHQLIPFLCLPFLLLFCFKKVDACECANPTIYTAFNSSDVVLKVSIVSRVEDTTTISISHKAKILNVFKGCKQYQANQIIAIETAGEESLCGVTWLKAGSTYLVSGSFDNSNSTALATSLKIHICAFQAEWKTLSGANQRIIGSLSNQYSNCSCSATKCGPYPQPFLCPDGVSVSGPSSCEYDRTVDGCRWQLVPCPTCRKTSDCSGTTAKPQYCSAGVCRAAGTCATHLDCWNTNNKYPKNCSGIPRCSRKTCLVNCKGLCPNGSPASNCPSDPCKVTYCPTPHVGCYSSYCGGCHAVFYNSSGHQVKCF